MKNARIFALALSGCLTHTLCSAQAFQNLDFEAAVISFDPNTSWSVDPSLALPGWTPYQLGGWQDLGHSHYFVAYGFSAGSSCISIHDGRGPFGILEPLQGTYSINLQLYHTSPQTAPAGHYEELGLAQTGTIPSFANSVTYLAPSPLQVRINGQVRESVLLSVGPTGNSYGVDVSSEANTLTELRFAAVWYELDFRYFDDVQFSTVTIPEPTTFALLTLGSLALVMVRRRR